MLHLSDNVVPQARREGDWLVGFGFDVLHRGELASHSIQTFHLSALLEVEAGQVGAEFQVDASLRLVGSGFGQLIYI